MGDAGQNKSAVAILRRMVPRTVKRIMWRIILGSRVLPSCYRGAWLLSDRAAYANDNAEHLFRYLRRERPDINAWYVLRRGTFDWQRLAREGYAKRLVPYQSMRWRLLLASSTHILSSHTLPRVDPWGRPGWPGHKIVFLRHGISQGDQSSHFNSCTIDLAIVSTLPEYQSILADKSHYNLTSSQICLTGLPRHDRLRELADFVRPKVSDLILVAPTWRKKLYQLPDIKDFLQTEYARAWLSLLNSSELEKIASMRGLRIVLLPHPNAFQFTRVALPAHVSLVEYENCDVQKLFPRAAALVTDYSSIAFDPAYIGRPVVYFQFDRNEFLSGSHGWRGGYFDYYRDGFGPV